MVLTDKWHGLPQWAWFGGAGVLAGVAFYVIKRRQGASASNQPLTVDTSTDQQSPGRSNGGGLGTNDWWKNLGDFLPPTTPVATPEVPDVPAGLNPGTLLDTIQTAIASTPDVPVPVPSSVPAAPAPIASLGNMAPVYEPWQQSLGLAAPKPWEVAEPVVVQDQIVGERFLPNPLVSPEPPPPQLYGTPTQPERISAVVNGFQVDLTPQQYDFYKSVGFIK